MKITAIKRGSMTPNPNPRIARIPYPFDKKGICRWCGKPIVKGSRRRYWCSKECTIAYEQACGFNVRYYALESFRESHDGKLMCAMCCAEIKEDSQAVVDHITPLAQGGTHATSNLQVLCKPCDKKKTKVDKGNIAKEKRIRKRQKGVKTFDNYGVV